MPALLPFSSVSVSPRRAKVPGYLIEFRTVPGFRTEGRVPLKSCLPLSKILRARRLLAGVLKLVRRPPRYGVFISHNIISTSISGEKRGPGNDTNRDSGDAWR